MANIEVLEKRPVSIAEVKDVLKKIHKRDEELSFRGGKTEEYVNDVAALSLTKTKQCVKALADLDLPRLREDHFIKIVDTMPESPEHLKVIMSGFNLTITKENLTKIVGVLDEYRPAK
jgi:DNA-directed RNA polymerase subunit F